MSNQLIFHHIRNSTAKLNYSGLKILVDPFFAPKEYYPGFELCPTLEGKKARIPLVDLPMSIEEIIKDIDAIIITHTHYDHWDDYTAKHIPKYIPVFVQHASDKKLIQSQGFSDVRVTGINTPFKGISITKTLGQHGTDELLKIPSMAEILDETMGFVLRAEGEKTIYFAGDAIWNEYVELAITKYKPDIIVLNAPQGQYDGYEGSPVMSPKDVKKCYEFCKTAKIIPVHMDCLPHLLYTTEKMKKFVEENNLQDRVIVPTIGEILKL